MQIQMRLSEVISIIRTKSNVNWKGTLYEYEDKERVSCKKCKYYELDGVCSRRGVDIKQAGIKSYQYCIYYVKKSGEQTQKNAKKIFNKDKTKKNSVSEPNRKSSITNPQEPEIKLHEKVYIKPKNNSSKSKDVIGSFSKVLLKRVLDDKLITVSFVLEKPPIMAANSKLVVSLASDLAKALLRQKKGKIVEYNGFRYIVVDFY